MMRSPRVVGRATDVNSVFPECRKADVGDSHVGVESGVQRAKAVRSPSADPRWVSAPKLRHQVLLAQGSTPYYN
jgi:hypothetical protein